MSHNNDENIHFAKVITYVTVGRQRQLQGFSQSHRKMTVNK